MTETIMTFLAVVSAILFSLFILFLPAIWELTKPEDAEPRLIQDNLMDDRDEALSLDRET
jgi:hypothetical protein